MLPLLHLLFQVTSPLINGTISNATNPVQLLQAENASPGIGGYLGFGISMAVFVLFTIIFSFRIKITNAVVGGAFIGLLATLVMIIMGIESSAVATLFVGMMIFLTLLALMAHVLHIFD